MDDFIVVTRIVGATILGGIVGFEREWEKKPAGLRTIMLVTLGSCLVMLTAQRIPSFVSLPMTGALAIELTRVQAAIIQGVGFLGAGAIMTGRRTVHGLTTAAVVWAMSAVGAAAGVGDWVLAISGTIACFVILRILGPLRPRHAEPHREKN